MHAAMLFKTEHKMDINIWESIPDTNNAEESINWRFYAACGQNHSFLEGLRSLFAVAVYYQHLFDAESSKYSIANISWNLFYLKKGFQLFIAHLNPGR